MQTITETIIEQGIADRFIKTFQLNHLLEGNPARRYGLVNRAIKRAEVIRIQRGLYMLADRFRSQPCHPFALAQALSPGSYISFETALAYHCWIPERVFTSASVIFGRKSRQYENETLGTYSFHPLAIQPGYFLELVNRYQINGQVMLIAEPCRAFMDIICQRKISWQGIGWLTEGLRIDPDMLNRITNNETNILELVYIHKRVKSFLTSLRLEMGFD